jgi:alkanesulfonate monooxygenase SsuD/methylene tetrahydromethanopterin reductase-like flavin-dependent oxidoreductase (luciferase family)
VGPRAASARAELYREAADHVEVVRRLWDSWDDDAEIRDASTNRFIDRDRIHYIDFEGAEFSVRGPSITPRPPQGQPIIVTVVDGEETQALAIATADVAILAACDLRGLGRRVDRLRAAAGDAGRAQDDIRVLADVDVVLDREGGIATDRRSELDAAVTHRSGSRTLALTGTPSAAADQLIAWAQIGVDGFRLRPAEIPRDLAAIAGPLSAELQRRGALRRGHDERTLRGRLGFPRPAGRYAHV